MFVSTAQYDRTALHPASSMTGTAALQRGEASQYPSLTTTVPKEFVHRAAVAEVLLTGWDRSDQTHFTVQAQWPRSHSFYITAPGDHHDPLIAVETVRQLGALLTHTEFGVPLGHHFLMWDCHVSAQPEQLLLTDAPASLDIDVSFDEVKQRAGKMAGGRYRTVIRRDGQIAATGGASFTCVSPQVYRRLRGDRQPGDPRRVLALTAPPAPQSVGRVCPMDVVLSPTGEPDHWHLRIDTRHPVFFDHPVDHAPGMLLVEAARQASHALLRDPAALPLAIACDFTRFVELDSPCDIHAQHLDTPGGHPTILVTGHQNGQPVFNATITA